MATGLERLVDVFVAEQGIVVVDVAGVRLLSHGGGEILHWSAPERISSAAFDGSRLVIVGATTATWIELRADALFQHASAALRARCGYVALASCQRLVCSLAWEGTWLDRSYDVYDASGTHMASSSSVLLPFGGALRPVPGREGMIDAASFYTYYRVETGGALTFTGQSPTDTGFSPSEGFVFIGAPATHILTLGGILLRIDGCPEGGPPFPSEDCLAFDGTLGTLPSATDVRYFTMETSVDGSLYALGTSSWLGACPSVLPCTLQQINPAERRVVREHGVTSPHGAFNEEQLWRMREDPWTGRVLLAWGTGCDAGSREYCSGWVIQADSLD